MAYYRCTSFGWRSLLRSSLLSLFLLTWLSACQHRVSTNQQRAAAAQARLALALQYIDQQQFAQAKYNLNQALAQQSNLVAVYNGFAYYYQQVAQWSQAQVYYQKALLLAPDDADTHNNYGVWWCHRQQYAQAEQHFLYALQNPTYFRSADTWENAARCAWRSGNTQKAIDYLRRAIAHAPKALALRRTLRQWSIPRTMAQ